MNSSVHRLSRTAPYCRAVEDCRAATNTAAFILYYIPVSQMLRYLYRSVCKRCGPKAVSLSAPPQECAVCVLARIRVARADLRQQVSRPSHPAQQLRPHNCLCARFRRRSAGFCAADKHAPDVSVRSTRPRHLSGARIYRCVGLRPPGIAMPDDFFSSFCTPAASWSSQQPFGCRHFRLKLPLAARAAHALYQRFCRARTLQHQRDPTAEKWPTVRTAEQ
jgi:hypothetical protein